MKFHDDFGTGKQLCYINHLQVSMHCDRDLGLLDPKINRANPRLMGTAIMQHKLFSFIQFIVILTFDLKYEAPFYHLQHFLANLGLL